MPRQCVNPPAPCRPYVLKRGTNHRTQILKVKPKKEIFKKISSLLRLKYLNYKNSYNYFHNSINLQQREKFLKISFLCSFKINILQISPMKNTGAIVSNCKITGRISIEFCTGQFYSTLLILIISGLKSYYKWLAFCNKNQDLTM